MFLSWRVSIEKFGLLMAIPILSGCSQGLARDPTNMNTLEQNELIWNAGWTGRGASFFGLKLMGSDDRLSLNESISSRIQWALRQFDCTHTIGEYEYRMKIQGRVLPSRVGGLPRQNSFENSLNFEQWANIRSLHVLPQQLRRSFMNLAIEKPLISPKLPTVAEVSSAQDG